MPAPDLHNALKLFHAGQQRPACALLEGVYAADPARLDALQLLCDMLAASREHDRAIALLLKACEANPTEAALHFALGNLFLGTRRAKQAETAYLNAIAASPALPFAHANLALALEAQGRKADAVEAYREAIRLSPGSAEIINNLGNTLQELKRYDEAIDAYRRAITLKPDYPEPHNNLGNVLKQLNRHEEAIRSYQHAIELRPAYIDAINHLGNTLAALDRRDEAIALYRKSQSLKPDQGDAFFYESIALLTLGDLRNGFARYEYRWRSELACGLETYPQPLWLGDASVAGKTVFVHTEQGLGDTLQFIRYIPLLAARGARVVLRVQAAMRPLLKDFPGAEILVSPGEPVPRFDLHCPLLSLPHAFGTELGTIPATVPYLSAPSDRAYKFADIPDVAGIRRIGLVWAGNPNHKHDHNRSVPLSLFKQLFALPGCRFFSLQKTLRDTDATELATMPEVTDFTGRLDDFADTAALIDRLDLIITVDTSVAHLAGAMGKPVWLLLPFAPDWRWLLTRSDSPWYPSMRLFRQPRLGNWNTVINNVMTALQTGS